ncbi:MAG: hypothetical protein JHC95_22710 [Solirubrobacteraceae bacterium]|nr:hypothetical protein [Solirubrobacteraceae bacterium]
MIVATYFTQLVCLALGIGTGVAGIDALLDGRPVGAVWLLVSFAFAFGEHASRRLRDHLAERDRVG